MAITPLSLAAKIKAKMELAFGPPPADGAAIADMYYMAIAEAIVEEFTENAEVVGTVTSGAGAGGNVTGGVT